ncbi:Hemolysin/related protein [Rubellimicrobium thermophilum DSM 16684]|uniref:Hemolysin/related protein n=1 Tax=Rubellimicrobium thermophilum DSM 16684 TaxID=1123069 RepID=S9SME3_9RHOB|nr:hemolysin family protein [Rubellimicrobium thermophilum]EPX87564.1 Hemolysin/related protein [Rubellimicrobium thermophilum DSM 16684]
MLTEVLIVIALILLNGALAMSELAVVSARPARLKSMAESGRRGAQIAIDLAADPGRFLSTVQIGITLVGILSGAFSGATLGVRLGEWLAARGVPAGTAGTLGVGGVVVAITYLSLILGELVPKRLALKNPEGIAILVAPVMRALSRIAAPVVWVLDASGRAVLRLLGQAETERAAVTEEEVRVILSEAHEGGVIEPGEREMLSGVMRLADRTARGLMTPRRDVEMLDADAPQEVTLEAIRRFGRPRLPVQDPATGEVLGVLYVVDAFAALSRGEPLDLRRLMREVPVIFESTGALDVISILRKARNHMGLVYDEYGSFEGIITTGDILEAITGAFAEDNADEPAFHEREDGSLLVSGWMAADEFCERMGLPRELAGDYETVAGLVLNHLHRLPQLGDRVEAGGWRFEVVDLDGRRIDKVLVTRAD